MQDRPTAAELLDAARSFLEHDVLDQLTGRRRFHTRVLINTLGILERELTEGQAATYEERIELARLLGEPAPEPADLATAQAEVRRMNTELAHAIREGRWDGREDVLLDALRRTVGAKLRVANPGYEASEA